MGLSTEERVEQLSLGISDVRIRLSKFNRNHVPSGPKGGQFASGSGGGKTYAPKSRSSATATSDEAAVTGDAKSFLDEAAEARVRMNSSSAARDTAEANYQKAVVGSKEEANFKTEAQKHYAASQEALQDVRVHAAKYISGGTVGKATPSIDSKFHPDVKAEIEKGFSDFNKTFGDVGLKSVKVVADSPNSRPFYNSKTNELHMPNSAGSPMGGPSTIAHELGHAVFFGKGARAEKMVENWHDKRVGEYEQPKALYKIFKGDGYPKDETTYQDKFLDAYMGKVYSGTKWQGDKLLTMEYKGREIPSMGMELLYKNPSRLAKLDPDMFNFMVGFLKMARR